jgi:hypothetical protein
MSKEADRISNIAVSNGVKSFMADVNLSSFKEFQSCVEKLSALNVTDNIFYVLFGNDNENSLFFGVVAPSDVKFDRTTNVNMSTFEKITNSLDNALFLLMEVQCCITNEHTNDEYINVQDSGWACAKVKYPRNGEVSAIKMKDTVRGFASSILKQHCLVTDMESDEEEYQYDFDN